jgi:hypothetical protein
MVQKTKRFLITKKGQNTSVILSLKESKLTIFPIEYGFVPQGERNAGYNWYDESDKTQYSHAPAKRT